MLQHYIESATTLTDIDNEEIQVFPVFISWKMWTSGA